MKKTAIYLMIITIFSKLIGFIREITLSYYYGVSNISDAYLIALTIPTVIFSFVGAGISTGYIPIYAKIEQEHGGNEGNRYTNTLVNILMIICTIIVIISLIFTEQLVKLFAFGFEGNTLELAVRFTRIAITGIYFTGLISVFTGFLQLKGNYIVPAMLGFPMNLIIIISIYVSSKNSISFLAIGSVIAIAAQLVVLIPFVYKEGYRYELVMDLKSEGIREMAIIALPVVIGVSVNQINVLVDRALASNIGIGGISALNYANRLNLFVQGIFVTSISTVMYPTISKMAAEDNITGLKKSVSESLNIVNLLVIPITVGSMIFSLPIVRLLYGRGAFDSQAITMTASALIFYSIGMVGYGLREILARTFYSLHDTKAPMLNAAIALIMNIILNIVLSKYMGINGLALATSISAIFCTLLLFIGLRKKIGQFGMKEITIVFLKSITASIIMGLLAKLLFEGLKNFFSANLSLVISICTGALIYFALICFMKVREVETLIHNFKNKIGFKAN